MAEKVVRKGAHAVQKTKTPNKPKAPGKAGKVLACIAGIVIVLFAALCLFSYLYSNIKPGVTVGGIKVGGMNVSQATQTIEAQAPALYEDADITVTIYDKEYTVPAKNVIGGVNAAASAENALAISGEGNPFKRAWQLLAALVGQQNAALEIELDQSGLRQELEKISKEALTEPVEPTWSFEGDEMVIHAGKPGVQFDTDQVLQTLSDKAAKMDFTPYAVDTALTETPAIDLDKIASDVIGEAQSATVSKEDGKTILPEKIGVQFDIGKAKSIIGDGSAESYRIPIEKQDPKVTAADLKEKLFRDTLASTATDLNEGNTSRTNNVRLAANAINGTILNPGDEFSYNTIVGERTPERGYQTAGAYANGQVIEEVGGGVCQPSSTIYMAVLRADLEVVERTCHMFVVSYTPLGEDATVDYPSSTDLRFKNNTDYPVKILTEQSGGQMKCTIVGTKVSDKTVETRTVVNETYSPQTVEKGDSSMTEGTSRVDQTGITGYSTTTYKIITEGGKTSEVLANNSHYTKRDKIVYVGTKPVVKIETPETESNVAEPEIDPEAAAPVSEE